uniref:WD repeat-containing protein 89 n=1 Tax=Plectus sambesii TaxID=2011161 RepID=A0A914V2G0_9BILA
MKLKLGEAFITWPAEDKNACYVLSLASNTRHILAQLSDCTVVIIDSNSLQQLASRNCADISLVSAHLLDDDSVILVGKNGLVLRWDQRWTRTTEIISQTAEGIACSAISHDHTRLAVGTEKSESAERKGDTRSNSDSDSDDDDDDDDAVSSTIVVVDLQAKAQLGVYTESHSDAVNCLAFHPDDHDRLLSGGADGLVNWFRLSPRTDEDEALVQTFDCGSSLSRVGWTRDAGFGTGSFAVTDDNRLTLFDVADDDDATVVFKTVNFKEGRSLVDCFTDGEAVYSIASDDSGKAYMSRRERSNGYATALTTDDQCHAQLIRCLAFDGRSQTLLTGGEDGKIIGRQVAFERDLTVAKKTRRSKKKGSKPY